MTEKSFLSEIRFSRALGLWRAIILGLGVMLSLFIFIGMGGAVTIAGPLTPWAYLLAALLVLANVLGYIELAVTAPLPGGAYTLVHEIQGGWLAFLTGWTLTLSGLGVCALLAQGFAVQVTTLLNDYLGLALPTWPWAMGLVILLAVNNVLGTRESWRRRIAILLMAVLLGFILLATPRIKPANYVAPPPNWRQALPLLMVSFVGLEVTASLLGEMRRRTINAPRALLLTPLLAGALGAAIVAIAVGVVGSEALADSRVPLALLGASVAGEGGRSFILVASALALALTLNWALMMVVRQAYAMSSDGYWPATLRKIQPRFKTPVLLIGLVALLVLPLTLLPVDFLERLSGLLYLLVLMGVNLTLFRRSQPASSAFVLPFHPWVPGLTLAVDVLVGLLWGPAYLAWAAGCLGAGTLVYLLYARGQHIEAQEGITVFKPPSEERAEVGYRVLVPMANPATAGTLLRLAGVLARQQAGEVLALQVVVVPDQVPLEAGHLRARAGRALLERAMAQANEEGFAVQPISRVARSVAQGILDTADEESVNLIVLDWRSDTRSFGPSMGPVIDAVIRGAPCDVTVVKGREWEQVDKILVPTAGGPNSAKAARLAMLLSESYGSQVTALYVQSGQAPPERMEENRRRIAQTLEGLEFSRLPEQKVIIADNVIEGIVEEAAEYDLVLLGASEEAMFDKFVFGSIPQQIAARVPKTVIMVREYGGLTELWIRKLIRWVFNLFPTLTLEERWDVREEISQGAQPGVNYFVLIVLSCIIATLGLLLNSGAVVIGAMLVAPLMSPIFAFSLGLILGDVRLMRLSIEAVFKGVALAVIIAAFIGVLSPFKELTGEIMARTQPTLLDLAVALASGMAGAYALARKDVSAALPGVAIAAALMPPLGAIGLGLALGDARVAGGASLLFAANIAAISLAGVLVFMLLGIRPQTWRPETQRQIWRGLIGFVLLLLVVAIPLAVIMSGIVQDTAVRQAIQEVLKEQIASQGGELVEFEYREERNELVVIATMRSAQPFDQAAVDHLAEALSGRLDRPMTLEMVMLPVTRSGGQ
ncbi:MAG: TIGR00341 family protein [Anaerolineales bacterium]|nr:MAG: TIGR00341 family protein [Anaerolineales bacterium]